jgi:hypothetical protein
MQVISCYRVFIAQQLMNILPRDNSAATQDSSSDGLMR